MTLHLSEVPRIERTPGAAVNLAPRDAVMLAWLALEGPISRARMAAMLWPAGTDAQARTALRQRLWRLQRAIGTELFRDDAMLRLPAGLAHDLDGAHQILGELRLHDAPELDAWLEMQRERRRALERDELEVTAQSLERAGNPAAALPVAQALLRQQPTSEAAHRRVMRLHYLNGDRAAALLAFDRCETMLKDDVGARPSRETLDLLASVEAGAPQQRAAMRQALPAGMLRPPLMVGRSRELAALRQAWDLAQVAVVVGEAGMGKTRLLAEFVDGQEGVVRSAGRPGDSGVPLATLARLLRAVGERHAAQAMSDADRALLARLLPELGRPGAPLVEGQRVPLQRAVLAWLQSAGALTGLVVDDLHFADPASLEMLQDLIGDSGGGALRWALGFRPADANSPLLAVQASLAEATRLARVEVAPLDEAALGELVDQLRLTLNGVEIAPRLLRRTGGNPLFALETLKQAWVELGETGLTADAPLPRLVSVEQLMDRRIGQLTPPALALARVAAIAGVDFTIALAESVLGTGALLLADALNELEAAQVLRGTQFTHDLVLDAVLRSIPRAIVEHTRAEVARWLEAHDGEAARIAAHWIAAAQPTRAPCWLEQAARTAARLMRNMESLGFLERKARIEADAGQIEQAFASQLEVLNLSLDVDRDSRRGEERCDVLAGWARGPEQRCEVQFMRSLLAFRRLDPGDTALLTATMVAAEGLGLTRIVMECHVMLALAEARNGNLAAGLLHAQACLSWIEAHGGLLRRGELQTYIAQVHARLGRAVEALSHHDQAIAIARELGVPHHVASVLSHQATSLYLAGRSREALRPIEESLHILGQHEVPPANAAAHHLAMGRICLRLGRIGRALQAFDLAEAAAGGYSQPFADQLAIARGFAWCHLGQWARVHPIVSRLAQMPAGASDMHADCRRLRLAMAQGLERVDSSVVADATTDQRTSLSERLSLQIESASLLGAEQAMDRLAAVLERLARTGFDGHVVSAHVRMAQVALRLDPSLARTHALDALALAETRDVSTCYRGELYLHGARALLAAGDDEQAGAVLQAGRAWVLETAHDHVPAEFRDSFLHRHRVNRDLFMPLQR
jgi:DNA-binding SARP family transcriptional activator